MAESVTLKSGIRGSGYKAKKRTVAILVAALTAIIFLPSLNNDFINWDDDLYVFNNRNIQSINFTTLKWMFTAFHAYNWHPLTWLSHAVDYSVWGLNPLGHHLTNVILHALNTLLVVFVTFKLFESANIEKLRSLTKEERTRFDIGTLLTGLTTGLLFGLHSIHVESVAWVSERKDVLCAFFYILSVLNYLEYGNIKCGISLHSPNRYINAKSYYMLSLLFFTLALLSKPMAVTLPLVIIILDIYPLKRLDINSGLKSIRSILIEKIPFFALSAAISILTVSAQQLLVKEYAPETRFLTAIKAVGFYMSKLVLPINLAPLYPYPQDISFGDTEVLVSFFLLIGITACCVVLWKRSKSYLIVWAYYLITLIPVMGIIQVGKQAAADRYMYLPGIGPFILTGVLLSLTWQKAGTNRRFLKILVFVFLGLIPITLSIMTLRQIPFWKNTITLFSYEIEKFPDFPDAYTIRGLNYLESGEHRKAVPDFDKSIMLNPGYAPVYKYRGTAYESLGDNKRAMMDFNTAIEINPQELIAYSSRGDLHAKLGDYEKAVRDYEKVIELNYLSWEGLKAKGLDSDRQYAAAYYKCATAYEKLGNYKKAIQSFNKVIELFPGNAEAYNKRGILFRNLGDYQSALRDFNDAIKIKPDYMEAYNNRAGILAVAGRYQEAIEDLDTAIELNAGSADVYVNRGMLYMKLNKNEQAVKDFQTAARMGDSESQAFLRSKGLGW